VSGRNFFHCCFSFVYFSLDSWKARGIEFFDFLSNCFEGHRSAVCDCILMVALKVAGCWAFFSPFSLFSPSEVALSISASTALCYIKYMKFLRFVALVYVGLTAYHTHHDIKAIDIRPPFSSFWAASIPHTPSPEPLLTTLSRLLKIRADQKSCLDFAGLGTHTATRNPDVGKKVGIRYFHHGDVRLYVRGSNLLLRGLTG